MPSGALRVASASRSASQRAWLTSTGRWPSGRASSSATAIQGSLATSPFLSSGIDGLLERRQTGAAIGIEEALVGLADAQVGLDQGIDGIDRIGGVQCRAGDEIGRAHV